MGWDIAIPPPPPSPPPIVESSEKYKSKWRSGLISNTERIKMRYNLMKEDKKGSDPEQIRYLEDCVDNATAQRNIGINYHTEAGTYTFISFFRDVYYYLYVIYLISSK